MYIVVYIMVYHGKLGYIIMYIMVCYIVYKPSYMVVYCKEASTVHRRVSGLQFRSQQLGLHLLGGTYPERLC